MRLLRSAGARRAQWAIGVFSAAIVASVALALAGLTWHLAGYTDEVPVAAPIAAATGAGATDPGAIIALAPFGTALSAGQMPGGGAIRLKGILLAISAAASTALIAGPDGKVASYGPGAAINGGVVEAIEPDRVIVRMPGGLQALTFAPGQAPAGIGIPAGSPLAPVGRPGPTAGLPPGVMGGGAPEGPVAGLDSGGLRVSASSPPMLFAAGLRPGDVVEQLNGSAVNAGMTGRELIARVVQAGAAQVVVVRNGQRVSLNLAMH